MESGQGGVRSSWSQVKVVSVKLKSGQAGVRSRWSQGRQESGRCRVRVKVKVGLGHGGVSSNLTYVKVEYSKV